MARNLLSPDLLEVKDADLVNLPAAVCALDEGFDLQDVVLRRLKLRLCDVPALSGSDHRCFLINVRSESFCQPNSFGLQNYLSGSKKKVKNGACLV